MFIQIWKGICTKANVYDYRGANPNHGGKKGLEQGIGGKINNFLAFKCCITRKEKWDFQLLTIGIVNKLNELADFNCCWIDSWPSSITLVLLPSARPPINHLTSSVSFFFFFKYHCYWVLLPSAGPSYASSDIISSKLIERLDQLWICIQNQKHFQTSSLHYGEVEKWGQK